MVALPNPCVSSFSKGPPLHSGKPLGKPQVIQVPNSYAVIANPILEKWLLQSSSGQPVYVLNLSSPEWVRGLKVTVCNISDFPDPIPFSEFVKRCNGFINGVVPPANKEPQVIIFHVRWIWASVVVAMAYQIGNLSKTLAEISGYWRVRCEELDSFPPAQYLNELLQLEKLTLGKNSVLSKDFCNDFIPRRRPDTPIPMVIKDPFLKVVVGCTAKLKQPHKLKPIKGKSEIPLLGVNGTPGAFRDMPEVKKSINLPPLSTKSRSCV